MDFLSIKQRIDAVITPEKMLSASEVKNRHIKGFGEGFEIYFDRQLEKVAIIHDNSPYVKELMYNNEYRFILLNYAIEY